MRQNAAHILAVDDEPINLALFKAFFFGQPYAVTLCPGGARAIEILEREADIDVVVLDLMMPEVDGFEVLRFMRNDARLRHVPVIAQSGNGDSDNIQRAMDLGADDYLVKPFLFEALMQSLRKVAPQRFGGSD